MNTSPAPITKREFFAQAAALACSAILSAGCREDQKAKDPLAHFPTKLDGAAHIACHPVQDAKKVLIVVRQIHESKIVQAAFDTPTSSSPEARACHEDIRKIVTALQKTSFALTGIFAEGIDAIAAEKLATITSNLQFMRSSATKNAQILVDSERDLQRATERIEEQQAMVERIRPMVAQVNRLLRELEDSIKQYPVTYATLVELNAASGIKINPLETAETAAIVNRIHEPLEELATLNKTVNALAARGQTLLREVNDDNSSQLAQELQAIEKQVVEATARKKEIIKAHLEQYEREKPDIFNRREDIYTRVIAAHQSQPNSAQKRGPTVECLLLGGEHDLTDNIAASNTENPDNKIALVVITPISYKLYEESLSKRK